MVQRSKTGSGDHARSLGEGTDVSGRRECGGVEGSQGLLQGMVSEVVTLLNEQAFAQGRACTEQEVCESFSQILLRHWNLCCVKFFIRGDDGSLTLRAAFTHPHVEGEAAHAVGHALVGEVSRTGGEFAVGLGDTPDEGGAAAEAKTLLTRAGLEAAVAVPISASGSLAGVMVVAARDAERLRAARGGVRCVGQTVVIALGNARRSAAMDEQHSRIESLVEELRSRTAELESANLELQRVGRYRSLFLARMSHELRTPLTSILGFAEIMLDHETLTDSQRRFCEKIQASGLQLQASLNQLVDLSRLEAGQSELFLHEFSLREVLRESCTAVARLAEKRQVEIVCEPEVGL